MHIFQFQKQIVEYVLLFVENKIPTQFRNEQLLPTIIFTICVQVKILEEYNELCKAVIIIGAR